MTSNISPPRGHKQRGHEIIESCLRRCSMYMHVLCIPTDVGCFLGQKANLGKKTCRKCNNLDAVMGHGLPVPPRNHAHLMKIIVFKTDSSQNKNHLFHPFPTSNALDPPRINKWLSFRTCLHWMHVGPREGRG